MKPFFTKSINNPIPDCFLVSISMSECENIDNCDFFEKYEEERGNIPALKGFTKQYCSGTKMDECVRKKVGRKLGGQSKVPENMMPDGHAIRGTTMDDWSEEVKKVAKKDTLY